jgi:hypothetical protein
LVVCRILIFRSFLLDNLEVGELGPPHRHLAEIPPPEYRWRLEDARERFEVQSGRSVRRQSIPAAFNSLIA